MGGPCSISSSRHASERILVHFDSGCKMNMLLSQISKTKPGPPPGGYKVGDTVYSLISHKSTSGDRSKDIQPGSKGTVKGPCGDSSLSDHSERILVDFDSGLEINNLLSSISKTKPTESQF